MENVTDRVSNPFGMRPPCPHRCEASDRRAVFGYGDANADFHVIGDHPGVHGGAATGIPFTGNEAEERLLSVLERTAFVSLGGAEPAVENCFLSYLYLCCVPPGEKPTPEQYRDFERFFDAELRAIAADVLLPVGERPTEYVLREHTSKAGRLPVEMDRLHATQVRGRGFLVIPVRDPSGWEDDDEAALVGTLGDVLATDYRQQVDLGRFIAGGDPYFVR